MSLKVNTGHLVKINLINLLLLILLVFYLKGNGTTQKWGGWVLQIWPAMVFKFCKFCMTMWILTQVNQILKLFWMMLNMTKSKVSVSMEYVK